MQSVLVLHLHLIQAPITTWSFVLARVTNSHQRYCLFLSISIYFYLFLLISIYFYLYESLCTLLTALPEGSSMFLKEASQAMASGVLHATEGTDGTQDAAESDGKCSVKIDL